jgi:hypothetical protein
MEANRRAVAIRMGLMGLYGMSSDGSAAHDLLRHTLATIAYRGGKALREAPASFADLRASATSRTPAEILAHIGDLFEWSLSIAQGKEAWRDSAKLSWDEQVQRFHATLARFDTYLASNEPLHAPAEKLLQGPIADALTHIGQLTMLRRMAGAPVKGENYFVADIAAGRLGPEQPPPGKEFD